MKAVCAIPNCRKVAPVDEVFCSDHRDEFKIGSEMRKVDTPNHRPQNNERPIMTDAIHPAPAEFSADQISNDAILRYFQYSHLPPVLQASSKPFCDLARHIVENMPRNAERTVALRKLLESKDAAVRSNVN
jgi:hypothetical protein